jgi:hypothetical protein
LPGGSRDTRPLLDRNEVEDLTDKLVVAINSNREKAIPISSFNKELESKSRNNLMHPKLREQIKERVLSRLLLEALIQTKVDNKVVIARSSKDFMLGNTKKSLKKLQTNEAERLISNLIVIDLYFNTKIYKNNIDYKHNKFKNIFSDNQNLVKSGNYVKIELGDKSSTINVSIKKAYDVNNFNDRNIVRVLEKYNKFINKTTPSNITNITGNKFNPTKGKITVKYLITNNGAQYSITNDDKINYSSNFEQMSHVANYLQKMAGSRKITFRNLMKPESDSNAHKVGLALDFSFSSRSASDLFDFYKKMLKDRATKDHRIGFYVYLLDDNAHCHIHFDIDRKPAAKRWIWLAIKGGNDIKLKGVDSILNRIDNLDHNDFKNAVKAKAKKQDSATYGAHVEHKQKVLKKREEAKRKKERRAKKR